MEDAIDRRTHEPLHEQVRKIIFGEIAGGAYQPGDKLPTEKEYAERLDVSLAPVRAALAQLVQSGHLERTQGRGTFVVEPKVQYTLRLLSSSTDSLRAAKIPFVVRVVECDAIEAAPEALNQFGLQPRSKLLHLKRVVSVRGRPAMLLESWLPMRFQAIVGRDRFYFNQCGSLYRRLREGGVFLARSEGQLDLCRVTDVESDSLSLPFGHPLFEIKTMVYGHDGQPIEKSRGLYDADRFALRLDRSLESESR